MVLNSKRAIYYQIIKSHFGEVVLAELDKKIIFLEFIDSNLEQTMANLKLLYPNFDIFEASATYKLEELFDKNKISWDDIYVEGSKFKMDVLEALFNVPFGELVSYSELAEKAGYPKAVRAVASIVANNPVSLIIPCHRIIRKNGSYGDYRWGSDVKKQLIEWEILNDNIKGKLLEISHNRYKKFSQGLIPTNKNIMLGVTIPQLRDLAKVIIKDNKAKDYIYSYLNNQYPIYYEEVMILGILIARVDIKIEERLNLYRKFIPLIDNWAVCDVFCGESKWAQREPILAWSFINEFNNSPYSFNVRFMIIMMLSHFIIDDYIDKIFNIIDGLEYKEDYYIDMGVAWLIATTYAKFPNNTFEFIKGTKIHNSVLKKAAQKIRDSRRVSDDDKMKVTNLVNSNK